MTYILVYYLNDSESDMSRTYVKSLSLDALAEWPQTCLNY